MARCGGALYSEVGCDVIFEQTCNVTFYSNQADYGGAAHISHQSNILYTNNSLINFKHNIAKLDGGAIYFFDTCVAVSLDNTSLTFYNNTAMNLGGAISFKRKSSLKFESNSSATFNNNTANAGGAICFEGTSENRLEDKFYQNYSSHKDDVYTADDSIPGLTFGGISMVLFTNNTATRGGAIYSNLLIDVKFNANSTTTFIHNSADYGGALCFENNADMIFKGNSKIKFINNKADQSGGAVHCTHTANITIQENCTILFDDNGAQYRGGAMYFSIFSGITIDKSSRANVIFSNNNAVNGGAIHIDSSSNIILGGKSTVMFINNTATNGGTIHCYNNSEVIFEGYINVALVNNIAIQGGAIYSENFCNISLEQNSELAIVNNTAQQHGAALFTRLYSDIYFNDNSTAMFNENNAVNNGGSVYSEFHSTIIFTGNSTATFYSNIAYNGEGGAIFSNIHSKVVYKGKSQTNFISNYAIQGGSMYSSYNSSIIFDEDTSVQFNNSTAISGGALHAYSNCYIVFQGNHTSIVTFINNAAEEYGGAINLVKYSNITVKGNVTVKFYNNEALSGGAMHANDKSNITITENAIGIFYSNDAKIGGAIFLTTSDITLAANCSVTFHYNAAWQDGGALYLDDQILATFIDYANVTFSNNTASDYGGAIYSKILENKINFNTTDIKFCNNHARTTGNSIFINVLISCNSSCLETKVPGISNGQNSPLRKYITTSPNKLVMYSPAYCVDDNKSVINECASYYVNNIMLGEEILIDACMYDYYDQPSNAAQFLVTGHIDNNQELYVAGPQYVLISCNNTFQGVNVIGNTSLPSNYTMKFTLYVNRKSEMKTISVSLTVGLVSCHPGYWRYPESLRCECYNVSDIVFCFGGGSTIKRGYWFGSVTGKPTVTFCPINFCNFTCCEISNGYYHLYPERDNQCRLHRSGIACGSCEEGYTLSFDSAECVHTNKCSTGNTILLAVLILLYWTAIIIAVFLTMHFKVNIGYFYGITYYYSVVDLMLSQNWYLSNELYTAIGVMSSITKVTPQFLGQLCLIKGMSGIDQQFIHYIHPIAISLFLIIITLLARRSHRLSSLIKKGIIHVICCLLLLSYTSVATTSLLLLRPLIFLEVDKLYTYVSPDIEYFHGRHLVYAIVAILFIIVIVIGLPLLLALEPFLNSKIYFERIIKFIRIKPLLDKFQDCYKDRYHCFAAYYMVGRLLIIAIVIANSSNFFAQYLLIAICVIISLTHQILKPYSNNFLNMFDGAILHLTVLVSVFPLVEFFDKVDSDTLVGIAFVLVLLPSVSLIVIILITNKGEIKRLIGYCYFKCTHLHLYLHLRRYRYNEVPLNDTETQSNEIDIVIDDSRRINATICDV